MKRAMGVVLLVVVTGLSLPAFGDTIILKNGEKISGRVVGKGGGKTFIRLSTGKSKTVSTADVLRVEKGKGAASGARPKAGSAQVQALALRIGKPLSMSERRRLKVHVQEGTSLTVRLSMPHKRIVKVDKDTSKLVRFTDDKGTDLTKSRRRWRQIWLSPFARISTDGHDCVVDVMGSSAPAPGARELRLKANIVLLCGTDERTVEQKGVALEPGSAIAVGPVPMKIAAPGRDGQFITGFGNRPKPKTQFKLTSKVSRDKIAKLAFIGPDGREMKYRRAASSRSSGNYWALYVMDEKVERATVRITYYAKSERVTVPVDLSIGLGL